MSRSTPPSPDPADRARTDASSSATTGDDGWLTLDELCQATAESRRTLRFYVLNGLLAAPVGAGPAARYPAGHVLRVRVVRALQAEGMQLSKVRDLLDATPETGLGELLARAAAAPPPQGTHGPEPSRPTPPDEPPEPAGLLRTQWERVVLEPGVELHIRRPLSVPANRRVQKLLDFARKSGSGGRS